MLLKLETEESEVVLGEDVTSAIFGGLAWFSSGAPFVLTLFHPMGF